MMSSLFQRQSLERTKKKIMEGFLSFQKEDQKMMAKNKEWEIFYQNKYKEVQASNQKKKQQQNFKYNQKKCINVSQLLDQIQLYDNAIFAQIDLQLPQPLFIQQQNNHQYAAMDQFTILFSLMEKNRIDLNKKLKAGEDQYHQSNGMYSKIRITTVSCPSWIAWTDILVTMEVQWKDIDKIKYCN